MKTFWRTFGLQPHRIEAFKLSTPTSARWLNQVERFVVRITERKIRCSIYRNRGRAPRRYRFRMLRYSTRPKPSGPLDTSTGLPIAGPVEYCRPQSAVWPSIREWQLLIKARAKTHLGRDYESLSFGVAVFRPSFQKWYVCGQICHLLTGLSRSISSRESFMLRGPQQILGQPESMRPVDLAR